MTESVPKCAVEDGLLTVEMPAYEAQHIADAVRGRIRQASHWEDLPRAMTAVISLARMAYTLVTKSRLEGVSHEDMLELTSMWWPPETRHVEDAVKAAAGKVGLRRCRGSRDPAWQAGVANDFELVFG